MVGYHYRALHHQGVIRHLEIHRAPRVSKSLLRVFNMPPQQTIKHFRLFKVRRLAGILNKL